ncbi:MAG: putative MarR family transcription regulator [Halieaceae bacterium]|jgi:predicted MarR family transcription regulator
MTQQNPKPRSADLSQTGLDRHWHLATDEHEVSLTEIEFAIYRNEAAFARWTDDLAACAHACPEPCNGFDYAILNVIRMHERAKSISEIARLMNRSDPTNLHYNLRKLTKAGLIEKLGSQGHKKGATYQATDQGVQATDRYARLRRELLTPLTRSLADSDLRMDQVAQVLSLLSGIYDQAACVAASHRITTIQPDAV